MKTLIDNLYMAWAIARKDIADALKHKGARINLILMILMVVFFYWVSTVRPWDKRIEVVVFDRGDSGVYEGTIELSDGYEIYLFEVSSLEQMKRNLRYEQWGLVLPVDFEQILASDGEPTLTGYLLWVWRGKVAELEALYSAKLSEMLGQPVRVEIGDNIVIPSPEYETTMVNVHLFFVTLFVAVTLVPSLMMEEKLTKTLDALLVSPASAGQVVMGKALAGFFYVLVSGGLFFVLNQAYVINWGLAILAFLLCALFNIGLALTVGSLARTPQQLAIWMVPVMVFLILPTVFAGVSDLAPGLKAIFSWLPTTALVNIIQYSFSSSAPVGQLLTNLAIVVVSTALVFTVVVWKVRRADRQ
jgi:ABC-type Na+ efflux pump permease subunit